MNWDAAFGFCARLGGHLAVINDVQEYYLLHRMWLEYYAKHENITGAWVDGTDHVMEGTWVCESINAPCPYSRWGPSQPDNGGGIEDCQSFWGDIRGLNDQDCQIAYPAMCEFGY